MDCYLKSKTIKVKGLGGKSLEVRAISAAGQAALMDAVAADASAITMAAITCRYSVPEWADETPESIAANISYAALTEIGNVAADLSGINYDPKASKSAPAVA